MSVREKSNCLPPVSIPLNVYQYYILLFRTKYSQDYALNHKSQPTDLKASMENRLWACTLQYAFETSICSTYKEMQFFILQGSTTHLWLWTESKYYIPLTLGRTLLHWYTEAAPLHICSAKQSIRLRKLDYLLNSRPNTLISEAETKDQLTDSELGIKNAMSVTGWQGNSESTCNSCHSNTENVMPWHQYLP